MKAITFSYHITDRELRQKIDETLTVANVQCHGTVEEFVCAQKSRYIGPRRNFEKSQNRSRVSSYVVGTVASQWTAGQKMPHTLVSRLFVSDHCSRIITRRFKFEEGVAPHTFRSTAARASFILNGCTLNTVCHISMAYGDGMPVHAALVE